MSALVKTPLEKLAAYLTRNNLAYPPAGSSIIDPEGQNEMLGLTALPRSGVPFPVFAHALFEAAALLSDEDLRSAVLVARMVRAQGVHHWLLRFIYESRGLKLHDDPE